jgi:hypothetical protein
MGDQYRLAQTRLDRRGGMTDMDHERAAVNRLLTLKMGAIGVHMVNTNAADYGSGNGCVHAPSRRALDR